MFRIFQMSLNFLGCRIFMRLANRSDICSQENTQSFGVREINRRRNLKIEAGEVLNGSMQMTVQCGAIAAMRDGGVDLVFQKSTTVWIGGNNGISLTKNVSAPPTDRLGMR